MGNSTSKTKLVKAHRYYIRGKELACKIKKLDIENGDDLEIEFCPMHSDSDDRIDLWGAEDAIQFVGVILYCSDVINYIILESQ